MFETEKRYEELSELELEAIVGGKGKGGGEEESTDECCVAVDYGCGYDSGCGYGGCY